MSIEKRGGRGVLPSKVNKKQFTTGALAAVITGIALFTGLSLVFAACRVEEPNYAEEDTAVTKKDTVPSGIVVTFKNGWEDEFYPDGAPEMKDDPYTNYHIRLGVTPTKINAAYDKTEKEEYDEAVKKYNKLLADWADYTARRDRGDEDAADYIPEEEPSEPTAPKASLPYFPGSPVIDDKDKEVIAGNQPEWDYHTFIGWEIYPAYPSPEGVYELTLTDAITANITAVAKWADAPARPFKEISFEKADGSGIFEKRMAIPTKLTYETDEENGEAWDHDDNPNTAPIYVTENEFDAKKDENGKPVIAKYELFKIQANDVQNEPIAQNNPLLPFFERVHYNVNTVTPWKNSEGVSTDPLQTTFETNAFVYQQWSPKKYKIKFDTNGIGSLNSVLDNLDAPAVAQKGLEGVGQHLTTFAGTVTHTDVKEYTFNHWTDAPAGGNTYTNTTKITGDTTLYAQWDVVGGAKYTFIPTGAVQKFPVPTTGTYKIEAYGAQGGGAGGEGGAGGYSAGTITLTQGITLYVYVGSQGAAGAGNGDGTGGLRGYNGGGWGGNGSLYNGIKYKGGDGGGGASDVRVIGGDWDNLDSLKSRIIVAGGGGGFGPGASKGGDGGGITGGNSTGGYQQMAGATQTDGGAFGKATDGGKGNGQGRAAEGRGAGGGGYYGGRGALTGVGTQQYGSGSGGSGYVKGLPETPGDPSMMSTAKEFTDLTFKGGVTKAGNNTGNGKVVITFIP